jgi:hypothetical protein
VIQKILTYAYIFLGFAAFWYWVSAILAVFRMLANRRKDRSIFAVIRSGIFKDENFTEQGQHQKSQLFGSIRYFFYVVCGLIAVVFLGVQTQG